MDGLTLAASVFELQCLIGGKIEKIRQPEKYELLFSVHTNGGSKQLLISSSTENCRIHLTEEKRLSPIDAPVFLMLLRKHLLGARITAVEQPNRDRVVIIRFETLTELHDSTSFSLVCEIMGKHSNIILVDEGGNIVDSIRRVSAGMSSVRLVLPHLAYELPPVQQKHDPLTLSAADFAAIIAGSVRPDKALSSAVYGLSPSVAQHLLGSICAGLDAKLSGDTSDPVFTDAVGHALADFYSDLREKRTRPSVITSGAKSTLLPFEPAGYEHISFASLSEAADEFYRIRAEAESIHRRTASLERVLTNSIQRIERKAEKFALSIGDEAEIDRLRLFGELLTANMYALPDRCRIAKVDNYYLDPPAPVSIPMDETLSAADNAQQYYKKYRKAKSARDIALVKRDEALRELDYLRGVEADLSQCLTDSDFDEIRTELVNGGYIRDNQKKKQKLPPSRPHHFVSSDGIDIYVGKNNTQNDRLTFKEASPDDLWLHTKDIHGSHVIVRCSGRNVPDQTLLEAAQLAAFYSRAKNSAAVPVDYTRRKYVKKPSGANPGMVIYTNQHTLIVDPDPELAERLRRK